MARQDGIASLDEAEIYQQIQHFYARQMRSLDEGDAQAWAETFTLDGTFTVNTRPEPIRGQAQIAEFAQRGIERRAADGAVRRHWLGMLIVSSREDGAVDAHTSSIVVSTVPGGKAELVLSTVVDDVLVLEKGAWLVRERNLSHDDVPAPVSASS